MIVVLTTVDSKESGLRLAEIIVNSKLAACVQILPGVTSVYSWQGTIRKDDEHLLLVKTLPDRYVQLEALITEHHAYEVPELVAIESASVSPKYREWLEQYVER